MNNDPVTLQLWALRETYTIHRAPEVLAELIILTFWEPPERGGADFPGSQDHVCPKPTGTA